MFVKDEDLKKYGFGLAQLQLILDGVRIYSNTKINFNGNHLFYTLQEVDLVAAGIVPSHAKYQQFDFTVPMQIEPYRLVVPWPEEESRLLAPIRPFELPVSTTHNLCTVPV